MLISPAEQNTIKICLNLAQLYANDATSENKVRYRVLIPQFPSSYKAIDEVANAVDAIRASIDNFDNALGAKIQAAITRMQHFHS
jgi:hypothetical protein